MASWSQKRKLTYGTIVVAIVLVAIVWPIFKIFYKAPTCFDGIKNGGEQGTDCGGACSRLCASDFLPPVAAWTRFEEVAPGLYNIAAYIVNPNIDGEAMNVPYRVQIYDNEGIIITEYKGTITLAPHRNNLAFKGSVNMGQRLPLKALFEFTGVPVWHKRVDPLTLLTIGKKEYSEASANSSLSVDFKNTGVRDIGRTTVYSVLYDKDSNALGFSKTVLDGIVAESSATAYFTWGRNRDGKVVSIEVLPVSE